MGDAKGFGNVFNFDGNIRFHFLLLFSLFWEIPISFFSVFLVGFWGWLFF